MGALILSLLSYLARTIGDPLQKRCEIVDLLCSLNHFALICRKRAREKRKRKRICEKTVFIYVYSSELVDGTEL